jgi:hypothetical protein
VQLTREPSVRVVRVVPIGAALDWTTVLASQCGSPEGLDLDLEFKMGAPVDQVLARFLKA